MMKVTKQQVWVKPYSGVEVYRAPTNVQLVRERLGKTPRQVDVVVRGAQYGASTYEAV